MREWWSKLRSLFAGRQRLRDELDEEMKVHLELEIQENVTKGMSEDAARLAAMRRFGNATLIQEQARESWGFLWIETALQDLRYGVRTLLRSPGFAAVAVLSLALGIGANTAIFTVIDALLLKMLPVPNPQQLVRLVNPNAPDFGFPSAQWDLYRTLKDPFSGLAAIYPSDRANITVNGPGGGVESAAVPVGLVSGDYFSTLGVNSILGRVIAPYDEETGRGDPVAVISYAYWERRFALAPSVLGRTITLSGTTYNIIGVTPRGFSGDSIGRPTDLWIPLSMQSQVVVEHANGRAPWIRIFGRLRPGVSISQAQAAAQVIYLQTIDETQNLRPDERRAWLHQRIEIEPAAKGFSPHRRAFAQPLIILMILVGLVLLIACANVANLLLARSAARQREIGIRLAIGAGRMRIARQLLTESLLLATLGGGLGLLFAMWGSNALVKFAGSGLVPFWLDVNPNGRVLAFTAALCLLTGFLFGLAPVARVSRVDLVPSLRGPGPNASARPGHTQAGQFLAIAQIALSLVVLIGAGLFVRTLRNLKSRDLGFEREHILQIWTSPLQAGRKGRVVAPLFETVPQRLASLPGVISASASLIGLLEGEYGGDGNSAATPNLIAPGYFQTVGMCLLQGRDFNRQDTETTRPVGIINEAMAQNLFGDRNPIGQHFNYRKTPVEIIGLVSNGMYNTMRDKRGWRMFYIPYRQDSAHLFSMCVVVRTAIATPALKTRIRDEIRDVDRNLPILKINSIREQIDQSLLQERLIASVSAFFGALAVFLACLGLYGLVSYTAARRTNEIGIRMVLGATRTDVLEMIVRESMLLVLAGIIIGVPVTLGVMRLVSAKLFGVSPADPLTIGAAIALMIAVAAFAGFLPALKASKSDPAAALRYD